MAQSKSILDQIIQSKNLQEAGEFNPSEVITELVKDLSAKEREVISRRFGLSGEPVQTLEEIGKNFQITRERIRQIQSAAVRKIKALAEAKRKLQGLEHTITRLLHEHGGIAESAYFYERLLAHLGDTKPHVPSTTFVLTQLLPDHVERIRASAHFHPGWKHRLVDAAFVQEALAIFRRIIEAEKRALRLEELIAAFKAHEFFAANQHRFSPLGEPLADGEEDPIDKILRSYLTISRQIEHNILGEWGLREWSTICPRRMGDKIYLILKQEQRPLHFTQITEKINQAEFDHKVAYPATIHNELILDERYVLVGRGMYALKEWGYEPGTVSEVITAVLAEAGRPMTRDEVVAEVGKRRFVRTSTIYLALTNKELFSKVGDRYQRKVSSQPALR